MQSQETPNLKLEFKKDFRIDWFKESSDGVEQRYKRCPYFFK
jgi:hypothetical protein